MSTAVMASDMVLAQLNENSADHLRDIVLGIVGALAVMVLAARALAAMADDRYGKMLGLFAGGALVLGVCVFPEQATSILVGLFTTVFGGGGSA